jgi:predicted Rossmann fold flavoprotein
MQYRDVIIIGAGAAGLMCAIEAGKRGLKVLLVDHANKPGKKILMSGGGRCNFTNYHVNPDAYLSHNPHFCKSALSGYTQWDFIEMVKKHKIPFHEKTLGQLFCDNKSSEIVNMLLLECENYSIEIRLGVTVDPLTGIKRLENSGVQEARFALQSTQGTYQCRSLVIATGGLSIPTMGASPFGYKVAEKFGIKLWPTRAGLVPFTLHTEDKEHLSTLSGIAVHSIVQCAKQNFKENILFTHRGLSGPAILQISSYWHSGESISINLLPDIAILEEIKNVKHNKQIKSFLAEYLPKRVVDTLLDSEFATKWIQSMSKHEQQHLASIIHKWEIKPNGTEGYRTAEVTLGGVDCDALSSKTMETKSVTGLYFIGEVVDVSGWLGGYNFQWAWSSGFSAGQVV